jgi:hypothetical protein
LRLAGRIDDGDDENGRRFNNEAFFLLLVLSLSQLFENLLSSIAASSDSSCIDIISASIIITVATNSISSRISTPPSPLWTRDKDGNAK